MDEPKLVRRARDGDAAAWELLMRQHQDALFRLAYLLLRDADDADDVAQEAFIRAYRGLARFDSSRPLRPWLLGITTNLARNQHRALGRYLAAVRRLFLAAPGSIVDPRREVAQTLEAQSLWDAVQRLEQRDREIVYLRYFLELTEAETAEVLEIAVGTAKSRLHRALKRLRQVIEKEFPALWEGREDERATI